MTTRTPALFIALLVACGSDDAGQADAPAGGDATPDGCEDEEILDVYREGLARAGAESHVEVTLVISIPGAPDKGENRWTLAVSGADGEPVNDAQVEIRPFMTVHGHPSTPSEFVGEGQGDGSYLVGPFILGMAGRWDITVDVTLADGTTDSVIFHFCAWG